MTNGSIDPNLLIENAPLIFSLAIVGVLGCLILLAVGLNMWSQERKPKTSASEAEAPDGLKKPGFRLPKFNVPLPRFGAAAQPSDPSAVEVLRVLRDRLTGRVVVEVGGQRYNRFTEILDVNVQEGLLVTLHDLQSFAGPGGALPGLPASVTPLPARPAPDAPSPVATALPVQPSAPEVRPLAPAPNRPPASAPTAARPSEPPPLRVPSMNPFRQAMVLRELEKNAPPPPKPIAEQIDDVLQVLVVVTSYAERGLHVRSGPRGNAIFEFDGQSFHSIDDIPEAEAQAIFRDAVKRWEQQQ